MKKLNISILNKSYTIGALMIGILLIVSCNGNSTRNQEVIYTENGIKLGQKLSEIFVKMDSVYFVQTYMHEMTKILSDVSPETYIMKYTNKSISGKEKLYCMNGFKSMEKVFIAFNQNVDKTIGGSDNNLREKVILACRSLDSAGISEELKVKSDKIKINISASKFKTESVVNELTSIYSDFWAEKSKKWLTDLDSLSALVQKGIEQIPAGAINTEKVKELVNEPYSNQAALANLYKLKLVRDNQVLVKNLQNQMMLASDAFNLIIQLQGEMMKRNKNKARIQELNERLGLIMVE
ncbi:MAG: hypothetical protein U0W24_14120 [Bacteroidales bacterium]